MLRRAARIVYGANARIDAHAVIWQTGHLDIASPVQNLRPLAFGTLADAAAKGPSSSAAQNGHPDRTWIGAGLAGIPVLAIGRRLGFSVAGARLDPFTEPRRSLHGDAQPVKTGAPQSPASLRRRHFSQVSQPRRDATDPAEEAALLSSSPHDAVGGSRIVLYKGKGIKVFRILVRMKIAQLAGVAAAAVPIATYSVEGAVPLVQLVASGALLIGAGVVSTAVWYYSSRYVGELSALADRDDYVVFSTMDFWGRRQDDVRHLLDVDPPLQGLSPAALEVLAERSLLPINVAGDRQYFVSLRHGDLKDTRRLMELMDGRWRQRVREKAETASREAAAQREGLSLGSLGGRGRAS